MIGIYMFTNKITGEVYVGQSMDIEKRYIEHLRHNESALDKAIHEYGIDNFEFKVIMECRPELLDDLEHYFIGIYHAIDEGYNLIAGGKHSRGESNGRAKLSYYEVYEIREAYKNHERKYDVYEKYKDRVSKYYFSNLWEGRSWPQVHCDVYTDENQEYYSKGTSKGENGASAEFTNNEVLELRKRYVNESARKIYESVKDRCGFQTLQQILWGRSYTDVPIYNKKKKTWNVDDEGCID